MHELRGRVRLERDTPGASRPTLPAAQVAHPRLRPLPHHASTWFYPGVDYAKSTEDQAVYIKFGRAGRGFQQERYGRETLTGGRWLDRPRAAEAVLWNCLRYQREKLAGSEKPSSDDTSDNVRPELSM